MKNIAFLVSGDGIFVKYVFENKSILTSANLALVIVDQNTQALSLLSNEHNVNHFQVSYDQGRENAENKILELLLLHKIDFIFLTYDHYISSKIRNAYKFKIFNLHLSLLPLHSSLNAIEQSHKGKELFSGGTLHEASAQIDNGRILGQFIIQKNPDTSYIQLRYEVLTLAKVFFLNIIYKITTESTLSPKGRVLLKYQEKTSSLFVPALSEQLTKSGDLNE
jgi:phosphoribosylglycinamide formyltransferase-1